MSVEIICPDCGGVIGGNGIDAEGRGPCTCVAVETPSSHSDTVSLPTPSPESAEPAAASVSAQKLCLVCGKDLSGHRRVKDSRGYMCYDCAKAEIQQEREGTVSCAECGKRLKPAGLVDYEGVKICRKCFEDHKEIQKKAVKKVATAGYQAQEKKKVIILAIVFGVLGLIILLKSFVFR